MAGGEVGSVTLPMAGGEAGSVTLCQVWWNPSGGKLVISIKVHAYTPGPAMEYYVTTKIFCKYLDTFLNVHVNSERQTSTNIFC